MLTVSILARDHWQRSCLRFNRLRATWINSSGTSTKKLKADHRAEQGSILYERDKSWDFSEHLALKKFSLPDFRDGYKAMKVLSLQLPKACHKQVCILRLPAWIKTWMMRDLRHLGEVLDIWINRSRSCGWGSGFSVAGVVIKVTDVLAFHFCKDFLGLWMIAIGTNTINGLLVLTPDVIKYGALFYTKKIHK